MTRDNQPVVVGVDGSEQSMHALDWAADEARRTGRPLTVVHGYELDMAWVPVAAVLGDDMVPRSGQAVLDAAVERLRARAPEVPVETVLREGRAAPLLLDASQTAAMVVTGTRGRGSFAGLVLGSTAVEVSAHAQCPVVVIRNEHEPADPEQVRIVAGVDGSPRSMAAVGFAYEEATRRGATLRVVHAWQSPVLYDVELATLDSDRARYEQQARLELSEIMAGWQEKYPDVPLDQVVVQEHPVEALVRESDSAELVVVAPRGRGGFRGLLLGSVSQGVINHAHCPVAVVHRRDGD